MKNTTNKQSTILTQCKELRKSRPPEHGLLIRIHRNHTITLPPHVCRDAVRRTKRIRRKPHDRYRAAFVKYASNCFRSIDCHDCLTVTKQHPSNFASRAAPVTSARPDSFAHSMQRSLRRAPVRPSLSSHTEHCTATLLAESPARRSAKRAREAY